MEIEYHELCRVQILHGFYLNRGETEFHTFEEKTREEFLSRYDIHRDLTIAPTLLSQRTLDRHGLFFKKNPLGFIIAVSVTPDSPTPELLKPLERDFRLSFSLSLKNPQFLNFTNLRLTDTPRSLYYFSTEAKNEKAQLLSLTQPVPTFDPSMAYAAGDLRVDDSDDPTTLFEAVQNTQPQATPVADHWAELALPPAFDSSATYNRGDQVREDNTIYQALVDPPGSDLSNTADWQFIDTLTFQYVTHLDRLALRPSLFNHPIPNPTEKVIAYEITDFKGITLPSPLSIDQDEPVPEVTVDLRRYPPGRYQLSVKDGNGNPLANAALDFYMSDELIRQPIFGLIELGNPDTPYSLTDAANVAQNPRYEIRFRNRSTFWRYLFEEDLSEADPSTFGILERESADQPNRFVTSSQLPLTRSLIQIPRFASDRLLPNPSPGIIKPESDRIFSEIYVNQ